MELFSTVIDCKDQGDQLMLLEFFSQFDVEWGNGDHILDKDGCVDLTGMNPDDAIEIIDLEDGSFILWSIDEALDLWEDNDDADFSTAKKLGLYKVDTETYLNAMREHREIDMSSLPNLL